MRSFFHVSILWLILFTFGCTSNGVIRSIGSTSNSVQKRKYDRELFRYGVDEDVDCQKIEYEPEYFSYKIDEDWDCQYTRAEILIRKSEIKPKFKTKRNCSVISGKWYDHYSGQHFYKAKEIHIDHVVPLKYAWDHGACAWSEEKRKQFGTDPENLLPVSEKCNSKKGARDPSQWCPPNRSFHREYLKKWTAIKKKYGLKGLNRSPTSVCKMMKNACKK